MCLLAIVPNAREKAPRAAIGQRMSSAFRSFWFPRQKAKSLVSRTERQPAGKGALRLVFSQTKDLCSCCAGQRLDLGIHPCMSLCLPLFLEGPATPQRNTILHQWLEPWREAEPPSTEAAARSPGARSRPGPRTGKGLPSAIKGHPSAATTTGNIVFSSPNREGRACGFASPSPAKTVSYP